jgi:enoyl-CoA hydratase/carnithine racemase
MSPQQALDWGLIEEIGEPGGAVPTALRLAEMAASMPPATVGMVKEAINATANALHHASAYADADQSAFTRTFKDAIAARANFGKKS